MQRQGSLSFPSGDFLTGSPDSCFFCESCNQKYAVTTRDYKCINCAGPLQWHCADCSCLVRGRNRAKHLRSQKHLGALAPSMPRIAELTPHCGAPGQFVFISGANLKPGMVVVFNGLPLPTFWQSGGSSLCFFVPNLPHPALQATHNVNVREAVGTLSFHALAPPGPESTTAGPSTTEELGLL